MSTADLNPPESFEALSARLTRLEESQAFSERTVELLREQLLAIEKRLAEVSDCYRRLEAAHAQLRAQANPEDAGAD